MERNYDTNDQQHYDEIATNTMYRLSLYESWSTDKPLWEKVNNHSIPTMEPLGYFAAANLPDENTFLIHGGQKQREESNDPLIKTTVVNDTWVYDMYRNEWKKPQLLVYFFRIRHSATPDNQGRIWIWGGQSDLRSDIALYDNRWTVIDTNTWTYNYPDIPNPPSPRVDHTATLVPNGNIIIIGGLVYSRNITDPLGKYTLNPISMNSLLIFNAASNQWQNITATGNIPAPRGGHSAVLTSDGSSIIIFGGSTSIEHEESDYKTLNDVFVLELATMRWSAPSIYGEPPLPRKYHYALLVDKDIMFIGFGLGNDNEHGMNSIHLLSTSSWTWISDYRPDLSWLRKNGPASLVTATTIDDDTTTTATLSDSLSFVSTPTTTMTDFLSSSFLLSPSIINNDNGNNNGVVTNNEIQEPTGNQSNNIPDNTAGGNSSQDENQNLEDSHVRAGVIAGVISGGVVA
ncbi:hypothetical protein INT45_010345, partial [Circinella minor]